MGIICLIGVIVIAGCGHGRRDNVSVPQGQTYTSPGGIEVYVPDADTLYLTAILERVDDMAVDRYPDGAYPPWSPDLRGLPAGWSWVLMGEGPFWVRGRLATGWADHEMRRVLVSTYLTDGRHFREHGFALLPAGEHEAAHAWSGLSHD